MSLKPLKLYSHAGGPNPWKVAIILNELNIPYETEIMDFGDLKKEPFESINPNGRVPAIVDPNQNDLKLWESGAIVEYLLATYDSKSALHYPSAPNKFLTQSWLHFQTSGQGPYFGQRAWFIFYHPEKNLESVLSRYGDEIWRVTGVIDAQLKRNGEWLVGDKCSYADLAFVPWYWLCPAIMGDEFEKEWESKYPTSYAWYQKLQARPAVAKAREERQKAMGQ